MIGAVEAGGGWQLVRQSVMCNENVHSGLSAPSHYVDCSPPANCSFPPSPPQSARLFPLPLVHQSITLVFAELGDSHLFPHYPALQG